MPFGILFEGRFAQFDNQGDSGLATTHKKYEVTLESFESLSDYWRHPTHLLRWECLFVLPVWLRAWWSVFGSKSDLHLCAVKGGRDVIGIAPLLVNGPKAAFIGDIDVCDYLDFIVVPGKEREFFVVLLDHLSRHGIDRLDLRPLRPDSTVHTTLVNVAEDRGCGVSFRPLDVALELDLPASWDEYLLMLNAKQRHEIRRKLRRLNDAARIDYRVVQDVHEVATEIETFLALFGANLENKAAFMTDRMTLFFRSMAETMAAAEILKLYFLDIDTKPVAAALCFDYNSTVYLYNNGYDRRFSSLSVGLLCKVFSIKDSIRGGRKKYDFLKGAETYKYRLGGKEVPLYQCEIKINKG